MKNKQFQNYAVSVVFALLDLGSYYQASPDILIEYEEAAADLAKGAEPAAPVVGDIVGKVNLNQHQPVANNAGNIGDAGHVGLNLGNVGSNVNNFSQNQIPPNQTPVHPGPHQTASG